MSKSLPLSLVFLFSIATASPVWAAAPTTISVTGEDMVYRSGQPNKTILKGRAMDTDGNLKNIHFYIIGPGYPVWNEVAIVNVSGFDDDAEYEWTVPSAGTWSVHIRAYDLNNTPDSNGNILNTFVAQSGVAPLTVDVVADDIVYQTGQSVQTNLAGHATDANDDLDFMDFYYSSSGWQYIGTDQDVEGGDSYGVMPWAPPGAGTWSLHFRARDKTALYDSNANIVRSVKARNPATTYNEATFVRFENLPYVLKPNETYNNVKVVMKNTGTKTWTSDGTPHRLGSQNPQDNTIWGLNRDAITSNVSPGSEHTFTFNITAPGTPGEYNFQWRMVEDAVEWFGEYSPKHTIVVEQDYATQNPSYLAGRDQDGDGWSNEGEARMGTSITLTMETIR